LNVVLLLWRRRLRASGRAAFVLVLLLGLGGAVTLSVAAGARRTASANDAILRATNASDLNASYGPADPREIEAKVRTVDGVAATSLWVGFNAQPAGSKAPGFFTVVGFWQDPITIGKPVVTKGHLPTGPNEAMLNEKAAKVFGVGPGARLPLSLSDSQGSFDNAPTEVLDVVGIGLLSDEVLEDELGSKAGVFVPRAFTERYVERAAWGKARVELAPGAAADPVVAGLADRGLFVDELLDEDRARVQDALRPLLLTLAGLAALAAATTILITGQAVSRLLRRGRNDDRSLRAMGCATTQLVGADLLYAATIAFSGAAVAAGLAVAASPLFPVGPARRARVSEGITADLVAVGGGAVALALALVTLVGVGSWRRRSSARPVSPGRVPAILASRPAAATGLRLVTAQRGLAVTLAGVAAGLAILVASVTFTGSLARLVGDQSLVGLSWELGGRAAFDRVDLEQVRKVVEGDDQVERVTGLGYLNGEAGGKTIPLAVVKGLKGSPWPPLTAGRLPAARDEVLVGRATLDGTGKRIGDTLEVLIPIMHQDDQTPKAISRTFRIVGSAVAPAIGQGGSDTPKLSTGVVISNEALDLPSAEYYSTVLFDLADGAGAGELKRRFPQGFPAEQGTPTEWFTSATPAEVSQAGNARVVIWFALAALTVAIVGAVVHTLIGSVRQRRREYALLKALGFTSGQVRTTVLSQSGAMLSIALVVAIPVGVAAGRWMWTGFAQRLGIVSNPVVPLLLLVGSVLAIVILVQGAALLPASLARRTPLAQAFRSE